AHATSFLPRLDLRPRNGLVGGVTSSQTHRLRSLVTVCLIPSGRHRTLRTRPDEVGSDPRQNAVRLRRLDAPYQLGSNDLNPSPQIGTASGSAEGSARTRGGGGVRSGRGRSGR